MHQLTKDDVEKLLREAVDTIQHDECRTCDCFQGFIVQLELDTDEDVSEITEPWKINSEEMHGCLGCDPCPPGAAFADYLNRQQTP